MAFGRYDGECWQLVYTCICMHIHRRFHTSVLVAVWWHACRGNIRSQHVANYPERDRLCMVSFVCEICVFVRLAFLEGWHFFVFTILSMFVIHRRSAWLGALHSWDSAFFGHVYSLEISILQRSGANGNCQRVESSAIRTLIPCGLGGGSLCMSASVHICIVSMCVSMSLGLSAYMYSGCVACNANWHLTECAWFIACVHDVCYVCALCRVFNRCRWFKYVFIYVCLVCCVVFSYRCHCICLSTHVMHVFLCLPRLEGCILADRYSLYLSLSIYIYIYIYTYTYILIERYMRVCI